MITSSDGIDILLFILIGFSLGVVVTLKIFYLRKKPGKVQQSIRRSDKKLNLDMTKNQGSGGSSSFLPSPIVGESFIDIKSIDNMTESKDEILFWKDQNMPEELPISSKMIDKYLENNQSSDSTELEKAKDISMSPTSISSRSPKTNPIKDVNSVMRKSTVSSQENEKIAASNANKSLSRSAGTIKNESVSRRASRLSIISAGSSESKRSVPTSATAAKKKLRNDSKKSVLGLDSKNENSDEEDIPLGLKRFSVLKD